MGTIKARIKRRQTVRRVTILVTVLVIAVSLGVGVYLVSQVNKPSAIDSLIGEPVSATDLNSLYHASLQPYGSAPTTAMQNSVRNNGGTPMMLDNKPLVVYIGADYCQYCAVQRWALVMALMRFGNFTGLQYMTSGPGTEGDYATFTFTGVRYSSHYIAFQPFEVADRSGNSIATVPANYLQAWQQYGSSFPFMNFGGSYVVSSSMLLPGPLAGRDWTQVIAEISSGDAFGAQVRSSANMITSVICKMILQTNGSVPEAVCDASPIMGQVMAMAGPLASYLGQVAPATSMGPWVVPVSSFRPSPR